MWIFWESKKVCGEHCVLDNKPLNILWSEARVLVATPFAGSGFRCGVGIQLSLSRKKKKKEMKSQKDLGSFCCQEKQAAACRGQFSCSRQDEPTSLFPEELGSPSCDVK